ncbi:DNA helicase [Malassezia brasiliensis]|uniref:DNA 3'-5' helicase n=1 Tax=Malassezia brasiliensis TaxID=1821822 RepID=A0AAF0DU93_9BASI|nr:DNA helicase [Malassezia brasiliensis]
MSLSASQQAAVRCDAARPLQILAGPGSGKTRVLTMRVAHLLLHAERDARVLPQHCVVVTFTNKAANEMRTRLTALIGPERTQKLVLGTFHALCAMFLRRHGARIGIDHNFTIADSDDAKRLIKEVLDASPDVPLKPEQALAAVSHAKARSRRPEDLRRTADQAALAEVYAAYQAQLRASNALDFDDLLMCGTQLLREHPSVVQHIDHVLVDEFQDTNAVQYELMRLLSAASGHVSVVGDPDQSIYSWRNAEVGNLAKMCTDFPDVRRVFLEENFRSTQSVLDAAIKVMRQDTQRIDKDLHTAHGRGAPVAFHTFASADEEAEYIALEIQRNVALARPMLTYADVCILLRFNALSRTLEAALQRQRIPYRVIGGPKFFDRAEVKDLLAYLLLVDNPAYTPALVRIINVPRRGIGTKTVQDLEALAAQHGLTLHACIEQLVDGNAALGAGVRASVVQSLQALVRTLRRLRTAAHEGTPVCDLLQLLVTELDFQTHLRRDDDAESRWQNVQELISFAASSDTGGLYEAVGDDSDTAEAGEADAKASQGHDPGATDAPHAKRRRTADTSPTPLRMFLENSMLATDTAAGVEDSAKVTISTCHAAKGLEWPIVFVPAVEEGTFPFYRSVTPDEQREERRLLYVAMTRAATNLYLSATSRRLVAGAWQSRSVSAFLAPLLPPSQRGSQPSGAPDAIAWCFGAPDVQRALPDAAALLHRACPDAAALAANAQAFAATPAARRLAVLEGTARAPPTHTSFGGAGTASPAPPPPRGTSFASALNALSSSALAQHHTGGNVRAAVRPPSQLAQPGRSLGVRRGVPGVGGTARAPSLGARPSDQGGSVSSAPRGPGRTLGVRRTWVPTKRAHD